MHGDALRRVASPLAFGIVATYPVSKTKDIINDDGSVHLDTEPYDPFHGIDEHLKQWVLSLPRSEFKGSVALIPGRHTGDDGGRPAATHTPAPPEEQPRKG